MTTIEQLTKIKDIAKECREAQRLYFKDKTRENLMKSIQLEQELDRLIFEYDGFQLTFDS